MSRSRPTRDERRNRARQEWLQERATAETVLCPDCRAKPGDTCSNLRTGLPLEHQTAHRARIRAYLEAPIPVYC